MKHGCENVVARDRRTHVRREGEEERGKKQQKQMLFEKFTIEANFL